MKNKLDKMKSVIRRDGFIAFLKKGIKYIKFNYISKINLFSFFNRRKYKKQISSIFDEKYDRIVVWRSHFGWNVPLFQRPQHIAKSFSKLKTLVLYETTEMTDPDVKTIKKILPNLYLVNFSNVKFSNILMKRLEKEKKPKYLQIYSTEWNMTLKNLKNYINSNYKIIYEYIDDLSPDLSGTKKLLPNVLSKYKYAMKDKNNVYIVVTADNLEKDVIAQRGTTKLAYASNGVDYDHFNKISDEDVINDQMKSIVELNKPIIGYYGALAKWFDYDLVKYLAKKRPDYQIVLIGIKYDDSFDQHGLNKYNNIHFLGPVDNKVLPNYATHFNICTIPFLLNDITHATSPLKLFEYMALGKPIITTDMTECRKYESVIITHSKEEFVQQVDATLEMDINKNKEYFDLLNKEALENTWETKARVIIDFLKEDENEKN